MLELGHQFNFESILWPILPRGGNFFLFCSDLLSPNVEYLRWFEGWAIVVIIGIRLLGHFPRSRMAPKNRGKRGQSSKRLQKRRIFGSQRFWATRRSRTNCRSRTRGPAITHCPRPVTWLGATLHGEKGREGGAVSVLLHHVHHVSSTMAAPFVILRSPTSSSSSGQGFSTFSRIKRGEQ